MRKTIVVIAALIVVVVAYSLSIPSVSTGGLSGGPVGIGKGKVRQLVLALDQYHLDSKADNETPTYPKTLLDLIQKNYLTEADLEKLTKDISIDYFPPTSDRYSDEHLLIVGHIPKHVIYGFVSGKVDAKEIK